MATAVAVAASTLTPAAHAAPQAPEAEVAYAAEARTERGAVADYASSAAGLIATFSAIGAAIGRALVQPAPAPAPQRPSPDNPPLFEFVYEW